MLLYMAFVAQIKEKEKNILTREGDWCLRLFFTTHFFYTMGTYWVRPAGFVLEHDQYRVTSLGMK